MANLILFTKIPGLTPAKTRLGSIHGLNEQDRTFLAASFLADSIELAFTTLALRENKDDFFISSTPIATEKFLKKLFEKLPIAQRSIDWSRINFHEQADCNFGERLQRAALECNPDKRATVIFGSDSPVLPPEILARALTKSDNRVACIGPSQGGGLYLMGLSENEVSSNFDLSCVFKPLDDCSAKSQKSDIERFTEQWCASRQHDSAQLEIFNPNFDIDVAEDLVLAASILSASKAEGVHSCNGPGENLTHALSLLDIKLAMSSENNRIFLRS